MDSKLFYNITYGLYVVSSIKERKINGQIANTVFQISSDPVTVAISINKKNLTHEFIESSKVFSVSILPNSVPLDLIGHFGFKSGRDTDKYQSISYKQGETGAPYLLDNTLGYFEAEVISSIDVETHTIFIGKVKNAEVLNSGEPMTYAYYQQVKRGMTPPTTPLQIRGEKENNKQVINKEHREDNTLKKYRCSVCGYVYDPALGDPDSGIAPGTAFEDIPDDWICPICGVTKDQFEPIE